MINKIKVAIYYILISKLPHSRFLKKVNNFRVWYVCNVLKIMKSHPKNFFEPGVYISNAKMLQIGEHCHINENVFIQGAKIGNHVMIAPNVALLSKAHNYNDGDVPIIEQGETADNPPIIENNVWIGRNAIIMPGVTLRKGSIVAAGAVVVKDVECNHIVGGVPAMFIKNRLD